MASNLLSIILIILLIALGMLGSSASSNTEGAGPAKARNKDAVKLKDIKKEKFLRVPLNAIYKEGLPGKRIDKVVARSGTIDRKGIRAGPKHNINDRIVQT